MKRAIFGLCTLVFVFCVSARAQSAKPSPSPAPKNDATIVAPQMPGVAPGTVTSPSPLITPAMKPEDQLKIRNLQYEQDKKIIELQRLKLREQELEEAIQTDVSAINAAVRAGGQAAGVDFAKFIFDLDSLKFVLRPSPVVNQSAPRGVDNTPKPSEVKKP
jgi:hypothetical protein